MSKQLVFIWKVLRPDTRQYKQQSIEVDIDTPVVVDVPDEMVLRTVPALPDLANGTDEKGQPVLYTLTLAGMQYVQAQFEKLFEDALPSNASDWDAPASGAVATKADDWGIDPATPDRKGDPDWDVTPATSSDGTEDDWIATGVFTEEPGNTPDSEVWNEQQEDWN